MPNLTLISDICQTLIKQRLLHPDIIEEDGNVDEELLRDEVKAVFESLDERDQLHTLRLTTALLKNGIISDKSETMECLKPILSQYRDLLKNSTTDVEPNDLPDGYDTETVEEKSGTEQKGTVTMSKSEVRTFSNIPMPTARRAGGKYPWETLEVGHSFFVPGASIKSWYTQSNKKNKELTPKKFIAREYTLEGDEEGEEPVKGVMVWRTT